MDTDSILPVIFLHIFFLISIIFILSFFTKLEILVGKIKSLNILEEEYDNKDYFDKILENSERYLLSLQFIKLLFLLIACVYFINSATVLSTMLLSFYAYQNINLSKYIFVCMFIITLFLTFLILSFSDTIPKKIALIDDKKPSFFNIRILNIIYTFTFPFVVLLDFSNNTILGLLHKDKEDFEAKVSEQEIKALVETASEKGVFNDIEKEMINSIFSFDDITARDIMVSRKDTYKIDINQPLSSYLDDILESYYSRIPVYRENIDDIIGILNTKDLLLQARKVGFENIDIEKLLQKPYFVPEMKSIDELFKEMQRLRNHMAILVDEYGGFSGIVTIEDLIEQIMGDINDEFDDEEQSIAKISNNEYMISGTTEIREINKELDLNLENENYDTISALVIEKLGYIPNNNEKPIINIDKLTFKVELASDNRIQKLRLTINEFEEENKEQS